MSTSPNPPSKSGQPPLLMFMAGLVILVAITGMLGYASLHNADEFRKTLHDMQQGWEDRLNARALPDQDQARRDIDADIPYLNRAMAEYKRLHQMLAFSIASLGFLVLLAFAIYRYSVLIPLRNLERSCRDLTEQGFRSPVWGTDRADLYGSLARQISDLRKDVSQLADMTVEGPDGVHMVRFSGRGGAAFNTLIADLQAQIRNFEEMQSGMQRKLEQSADHWQKKAEIMGDAVMQNSTGLHESVENARQQLDVLQGSQLSIQNDAKRLVARFEEDMEKVKEIATAAGQRVAHTLMVLSTSDNDLRRATQQNLEASEIFSTHAAELSEKLVAATNLMRASGKVMSETTEAARTRFLEAVKSVETHDQALQAFLTETASKTDQISALYSDLSANSHRIGEVVSQFDTRMADFDAKSNDVFGRVAIGAQVIDEVSSRLNGTHATMAASMDSMRGHTEMLAGLLGSIRDEYSGMMDSVRMTIAEANPAIEQLKEAGQNIHGQLQHEWTLYAQQSRGMLATLEQEIRGINSRTAEVSRSTEALIQDIRGQTAHLNQSAANFDLQVGGISDRIENAVTSVVKSNQDMANSTAAQMQEIHGSVSEVAQRLSILTQLTGTLGAVAGQLGQIVPSLSEASLMARGNALATMANNNSIGTGSGSNAAINARFEQLNKDFTGAIQHMRGEFDGVRDQITKWVETISSGYQRLAQQINGIDGVLENKLATLKLPAPAPSASVQIDAAEIAGRLAPSLQLIHQSLADDATASRRLVENIESLRGDLNNLREQVMSSSGALKGMNELLADGFNRLEGESGTAPSTAPALIAKLENITKELNVQTVVDAVHRLQNITESLEKIADHAGHPAGDEKAG